jgi:hypothetical protein
MNIIFIDIDGPLSSIKPRNEVLIDKGPNQFNIPYSWDIEDCIALNTIVEKTNSKLVLSSDWRFKYSFLQMRKIFENYGINPEHLIDFTTLKFDLSKSTSTEDRIKLRSQEILLYVNGNKIQNWVAIDDLMLVNYIGSNHIQVDGYWCPANSGKLRDKIDLVIGLFNI